MSFAQSEYAGKKKTTRREKFLGEMEQLVPWARLAEGEIKKLTQQLERLKAQVRPKVEHGFHVIKNLFGYRKVRYRGLAKNTAQLHTLFALANLALAKSKLLAGAHEQ